MAVLNDLFNVSMMGEPQRLDYIIREHEKLQRRISALEELLRSKGLITADEQARLTGEPALQDHDAQ